MAGGNIEIVRRGYDAWNRGDLGGVLDLVDPEFDWERVDIPWSGTMRTREEFESYLRSLGRIWETFRLEPEELREIGDAVRWWCSSGRASGVEAEQRLEHLWSFRNRRRAACRRSSAPVRRWRRPRRRSSADRVHRAQPAPSSSTKCPAAYAASAHGNGVPIEPADRTGAGWDPPKRVANRGWRRARYGTERSRSGW
jgi:ketosteroid isomerase-like protein